jgi:hypothetical protein
MVLLSQDQSDQGAIMNRKLSPHSRGRRTTQRQVRRLAVEALEDRCLLSGTWTPLTNPLPDMFGATHEMLLSDGTVMIQGGGAQATSKNWYKLAPDATGSYINGTFSPRASMSLERLFFGTNVLPSGKVFLVGGEFSGPNAQEPKLSSKGEIYDPVTDTWTPIPDARSTRPARSQRGHGLRKQPGHSAKRSDHHCRARQPTLSL